MPKSKLVRVKLPGLNAYVRRYETPISGYVGYHTHKIHLPYTFDPSVLADGALPAPWEGSTFAISSGVVINTPTLGDEGLTDPGLEANYTAGKCDTLTKVGSPTLAEETSDVHGGSKAQDFTGVAVNNSLAWAARAGIAGQWYLLSAYSKRLSGSTNTACLVFVQTAAIPAVAMMTEHNQAAYTKRAVAALSTSTNNITPMLVNEYGSADFCEVLLDDASLKPITRSSLYALINAGRYNLVAKVQPDTLVDGTLFGVVVRADGITDPANCILVLAVQYSRLPTRYNIYVITKVGDTYASQNPGYVTIVENAWLQTTISGTTLQVFYNGVQVGSDITVDNAALNMNTRAGLFSAGGNKIKSFFVEAS